MSGCMVWLFLCIFAPENPTKHKRLKMKNLFKMFPVLAAVAAMSFMSCGEAENEISFDRYYESIFTVNKATIAPELEDTSYMVMNMDKFELQTGDRARMKVRYYYDSNVTKFPEWTIQSVVEVIPTRQIVAKDAVDAAEYNAPVVLNASGSLYSYVMGNRPVDPIWVWNNIQNVYVHYRGISDNAQFALSVKGVKDGCVELQLHIKAAALGNVKSDKLVSFDLRSLENVLTESEKASLRSYDKLKTQVFLTYLTSAGKTEVGATPACEFANPFKK